MSVVGSQRATCRVRRPSLALIRASRPAFHSRVPRGARCLIRRTLRPFALTRSSRPAWRAPLVRAQMRPDEPVQRRAPGPLVRAESRGRSVAPPFLRPPPVVRRSASRARRQCACARTAVSSRGRARVCVSCVCRAGPHTRHTSRSSALCRWVDDDWYTVKGLSGEPERFLPLPRSACEGGRGGEAAGRRRPSGGRAHAVR